ncbi:flavin monoamine oxidase family protein [Okeania sp. SIO2B3]|uniref:flavin monoamine oxidase family protein n=1 Tax=Okeania sp. SIO2B3 TaxID=2607784 RepID=UPI0013C11285|nr:FAD-dependent oxidoreductase [Okeania sp. SIO2B3]NET43660.1 FAD-dependent oxidoreductase [Okeania sp. SIO2B3]
MTKSPVMTILGRAHTIARMSTETGIPSDELLGIVKEAKARKFPNACSPLLKGGLDLAQKFKVSLLSKSGERVMAQTTPVLIVGAGIAGLTAAYRLTQAGVPVNVIEASNRVGGRIRTRQKALGTPFAVELGGEFIYTEHIYLRSLVEELGLRLVDLQAVDENLETQETYFFEGRKVSLAEITTDFAPIAEQINRDFEAIANFKDYTTKIPAAVELDNISIAEYLDQIPQTTPAIRQLVKAAYETYYGLNMEEQSSLNLIYIIGAQVGKFGIIGAIEQLFYVQGGNELIPQKLANLVSNSIETGTILEAINSLSDGRYRVVLRSGNSTFERTYERILLTLPLTLLRQVQLNVDLPPLKKLSIDTASYGTNSKLITTYQEKIWRTRYNSTANVYLDLGFQNTWETSESRYHPGMGLITQFVGGTEGVAIGTGSPEIHAQKLNSQLEQVFPGISNISMPDRTIRSYWPGEVYVRGSYLCYKPGEWTKFYGVERERVGNIFFAGEHTSILENQGYMEGGCQTGEIAAMEILQDLGLEGSVEAMISQRAKSLRKY